MWVDGFYINKIAARALNYICGEAEVFKRLNGISSTYRTGFQPEIKRSRQITGLREMDGLKRMTCELRHFDVVGRREYETPGSQGIEYCRSGGYTFDCVGSAQYLIDKNAAALQVLHMQHLI